MSDLYRYMYISYEVIICFGTILKLSVYLTAIARYNDLEINLTLPWNSTTHIFMLIHNTYLWYSVLKNISLIMILESVICSSCIWMVMVLFDLQIFYESS